MCFSLSLINVFSELFRNEEVSLFFVLRYLKNKCYTFTVNIRHLELLTYLIGTSQSLSQTTINVNRP